MSCGWPVDRTCLPELPLDDTSPEYDIALANRNAAENLAVHVLWALSGRQFGDCPVIARPCPSPPRYAWRSGSSYDQSVAPWTPTFAYGRWTNVPCGCAGSTCVESGPNLIHLAGPAGAVTEVKINGVVLAPSNYAQEGNRLYRLDAPWPRQDLSKPAGADGTWTVTYVQGNPPPAYVGKLVGSLAAEMILACNGNKCRLPRTVVATSRGGVSHVFDPSRMLSLGYTGLSECDSWIAAVNPNRLQSGPRVR